MSESLPIPPGLDLGEWLRADGPDHDIALCTRVRFARNVEGYRFAPMLDAEEARNLEAYLTQQLAQLDTGSPWTVLDVRAMPALDRELLVERHLISRDHAVAERPRSVARDECERVSIMINEEDHLRSQVFRSGAQIDATYAAAEQLDDALLGVAPLAFSEEFGFLTSCPTNVGTGLRLSVMLHLPGLVWSEDIEQAANSCQKIHLAVRGLYGEGSRALGDFYQVSNQVTLGRSEEQIVEDVQVAVARLLAWEREVREALLQRESRARTLDRIYRALGTLQNARILTSEECLNGLSAVRFGVQQEVLTGLTIRDLNRILLLSQPAHLQKLHGRRLDPSERDRLRADLVRAVLEGSGRDGPGGRRTDGEGSAGERDESGSR